MNQNDRIENLKKESAHFVWLKERYENKLKEFAERFTDNPASAFEWAGNSYHHAAGLEVCETILSKIDDATQQENRTIADVTRFVLQRALYLSSNRSSSTSTSCNLINQHRAAAWSEAAQRLAKMHD